jgi:hypothetical protein
MLGLLGRGRDQVNHGGLLNFALLGLGLLRYPYDTAKGEKILINS